jgi:hypothetical protein
LLFIVTATSINIARFKSHACSRISKLEDKEGEAHSRGVESEVKRWSSRTTVTTAALWDNQASISMPKKKSPKTRSMNFIAGTPLDTDISMGKGRGVAVREGNKLYHDFIVANLPQYSALTKMERTGLFKEMVETLKRNQGRFFDTHEPSGRYFEVCDSVARAKVGQVRIIYI